MHNHPDNVPTTAFEAQYSRIFEVTGCRTQTALSEILEVKQSSISDAKKRSSLPAEWLVKLFDKMRVNPDWIRKGIGPKTLLVNDAGTSAMVGIINPKPINECTTDELMAELARRVLRKIS